MAKFIRKAKGQNLEVNWSKVLSIGIDLGDRVCHYVALDANGECVTAGRVPTTAEAFEATFGAIGSKTMAIETGTHSPWVSRLLKQLGHGVTVANSRKLRLIYENRNKNDNVDAEYLARLVRVDPKLLHPVEHRGEGAQEHIALLRSRNVLVQTRARLVTHVRGAVKSTGARVPACSVEAFVKRTRPVVPSTMRGALEPILLMIEQLGRRSPSSIVKSRSWPRMNTATRRC